jgi:hypothetical protein
MRWMVLHHPPDCIGFFQMILVIRLPSGDITSSDGEAAQHLLMTHIPGCQPIEEYHSSGGFYQNLPRRTGTSLRRWSARTK